MHCDFVIIQLVGPDLSVFYNNLGQNYGTWRKDLNILGLFCQKNYIYTYIYIYIYIYLLSSAMVLQVYYSFMR